MVDLRQFLAGNGRRLLFDVAQAAFLPELQHGIEEILAVPEVPVEAAPGDTEVLGQNLDAQARNPMLGEHVDGAFDPVVAVELCACPAFGCHWSEFVTIRWRISPILLLDFDFSIRYRTQIPYRRVWPIV